MKITNRPYDQDQICHGCKNAYLINEHLLTCSKLTNKNRDLYIEIHKYFEKYELEYSLKEIFNDYGL